MAPSIGGTEADDAFDAFAIWNLLIRPPRASYEASQLGPREFTVQGVRAVRRDVRLRTKRGTRLACSHFVPRQDREQAPLRKFPVIIYLHGNSSSRLEASSVVEALISQSISLFCYDAAGCGHSDGKYVSLGWHEREDLAAIVVHLRQSPFCGPIGLWGRSMGAVTALMYADQDPSLGAICLDSPFECLRRLAEELASSNRIPFPLPSWMVGAVLSVIRMRVKTLANFDIENIVPLEHARRSFVPAMFLHARDDDLILPHHSRNLYRAYAGDKQYVQIDGDHNSERSQSVVSQAVAFFRRAFRLDEVDLAVSPESLDDLTLPEVDGTPSRVPPPRYAAPLPPPTTPPSWRWEDDRPMLGSSTASGSATASPSWTFDPEAGCGCMRLEEYLDLMDSVREVTDDAEAAQGGEGEPRERGNACESEDGGAAVGEERATDSKASKTTSMVVSALDAVGRKASAAGGA
mmetsp:Transcript_145887/g.379263  ORF Transcript_145887/g.379263 Transcript_145887/m.379263 type:complete len:463 (+) Transcript_145887:54-1442(+)